MCVVSLRCSVTQHNEAVVLVVSTAWSALVMTAPCEGGTRYDSQRSMYAESCTQLAQYRYGIARCMSPRKTLGLLLSQGI